MSDNFFDILGVERRFHLAEDAIKGAIADYKAKRAAKREAQAGAYVEAKPEKTATKVAV